MVSSMRTAMPMRMRRRMVVGLARHVRRDDDQLSITHAALADHMSGKMLDLGFLPAQKRHFEAALRVDMNMQGGDGEIRMAVMILHQPLRQLARLMVVDIDQRRHALARPVVDLGCFIRPARTRSRTASERF